MSMDLGKRFIRVSEFRRTRRKFETQGPGPLAPEIRPTPKAKASGFYASCRRIK